MNSAPKAFLLETADIPEIMQFLKNHEESSQFLINNIRERGLRAGADPYSGNVKAIKADGKIVAVFYLATGGNLYAQATGPQYAKLIVDSCKEESFPVKGFLGSWDILFPIYEVYSADNPQFKPTYHSKGILYRLELGSHQKQEPKVRLLDRKDFEQWFPFRMAYLEELSLTNHLSASAVRDRFSQAADEKRWWGYFENEILVSMAGLNPASEKIGQVGGVFTPEEKRQRGLSKATMLHLLHDCRVIHGRTKSILFTGETDFAAQKLYESIHYERIGHFALILS